MKMPRESIANQLGISWESIVRTYIGAHSEGHSFSFERLCPSDQVHAGKTGFLGFLVELLATQANG